MAGVVDPPDVRSGGEPVVAFVVPRRGEVVHEAENRSEELYINSSIGNF
jgi:hypothetical protein